MIGVGDNSYSDVALRWMLEELVDDGDTIICLRVKEKEAVEDEYKAHVYKQTARDILAQIQERNEAHRAISIVLEFAIGDRIHTFQRMVGDSRNSDRRAIANSIYRLRYMNLLCL